MSPTQISNSWTTNMLLRGEVPPPLALDVKLLVPFVDEGPLSRLTRPQPEGANKVPLILLSLEIAGTETMVLRMMPS